MTVRKPPPSRLILVSAQGNFGPEVKTKPDFADSAYALAAIERHFGRPIPADVYVIDRSNPVAMARALNDLVSRARDSIVFNLGETPADTRGELISGYDSQNNVLVIGNANSADYTALQALRGFSISAVSRSKIKAPPSQQLGWQAEQDWQRSSSSQHLPSFQPVIMDDVITGPVSQQHGPPSGGAEHSRVFWITDQPDEGFFTRTRLVGLSTDSAPAVMHVSSAATPHTVGFIATKLATSVLLTPRSAISPAPLVFIDTDATKRSRVLWVGRLENGVTVVGPPTPPAWAQLLAAGAKVRETLAPGSNAAHASMLHILDDLSPYENLTPQQRTSVGPARPGVVNVTARGDIQFVLPVTRLNIHSLTGVKAAFSVNGRPEVAEVVDAQCGTPNVPELNFNAAWRDAMGMPVIVGTLSLRDGDLAAELQVPARNGRYSTNLSLALSLPDVAVEFNLPAPSAELGRSI